MYIISIYIYIYIRMCVYSYTCVCLQRLVVLPAIEVYVYAFVYILVHHMVKIIYETQDLNTHIRRSCQHVKGVMNRRSVSVVMIIIHARVVMRAFFIQMCLR